MRKLHSLTTLLCAIFAFNAFADATALKKDHTDADGNLLFHTVTVFITVAEQDAGRPGAFYIGVQRNKQDLSFFTPSGWRAWEGGRYDPVAIFAQTPSNTQSYVVVDQRKICDLAGSGEIDLWAGYGVLNEQAQNRIETFHTIRNPRISPEHLRETYVQQDMTQNMKYWNVMKYNCEYISIPGG